MGVASFSSDCGMNMMNKVSVSLQNYLKLLITTMENHKRKGKIV